MCMTIDQFKNFAMAAAQPNGTGEDTVAHMVGEAPNRRVEGRTWQRLGTRTSEFKQQNTVARQAFVEALKQQFGVGRVQDIPRTILAPLNLEDFGLDGNGRVTSDKPLTARRILAVTKEVDKLRTLDQRIAAFRAIAGRALTAACTKDFVALVQKGELGSGAALEAFVVRHFGGDVGTRLAAVMVQSGADRQALCRTVVEDLLAAVRPALVQSGVTRAQLEPVKRALGEIVVRSATEARTLARDLALTFVSAFDQAVKGLARDAFESRIAARMDKIDAISAREVTGAFSKRIRSEHGRDILLRCVLDGLANFERLSDDGHKLLESLLLKIGRHTAEMGPERMYLLLRRLNSVVQAGTEGVNRMFVRQVLGTMLKDATDLTDADLKQFTTARLFNFAFAAADDALVRDCKTLTAWVKRQEQEVVRQNYTDAETQELMAFTAEQAAPADEPQPAQPVAPAAEPPPDPARAQALAENKIVCDNVMLLSKLLHREDVWTLDEKGSSGSVYDTLTQNPDLVRSLEQNWTKADSSMSLLSAATAMALNRAFYPERTGISVLIMDKFTGSINGVNKAVHDFATARTDEAKRAACDALAAHLDALAKGLMEQTQKLLNENLNKAMEGMGFGGNFKDLPAGQNPENADLLALAKSRYPQPRNETKPQRQAREAKILEEYSKLVVDPQAGGLGTLLTSLTSNYMRQLDRREQRAMISGALAAVTPELLTDALKGQSIFGLVKKAMPKFANGEGKFEEVEAELKKFADEPLTPELKNLIGEITGGILKGAGPVLQKMVQMLGVQNMPPYLRKAIRECKSELKPIPAAYVQAKLAEIVRRSNGRIRALDNPQSIGAASIAQAFTCTLTDADGHSRTVVVKMLRPDVRGRMEREIAAIRASVAGAGEGALRTLNARITSLLAELDFTEERANIDACQNVYGHSPYTTLASVEKAEGCPDLPDVLVMERAPGQTFQRYMDNTTARLNELLENRVEQDERGHYKFTPMTRDEQTRLSHELTEMYKDVRKRQASLQRLVEVWFSNALFGDGKFHGDLHGGNIMVDDTGKLTVIDFGNAPTFSSADRKHIVQMVVSTMRGKPAGVLDAVKALVSDASRNVLETNRAALTEKFRQMFAVGSYGSDAQARLTTVFGELARAGVEVPEALYNFVEAFGRLQQLSASMEATLTRISGALPYMRCHDGDERFPADTLNNKFAASAKTFFQRTCDELIDTLLMKDVENFRAETVGISEPKIFEKLAQKISSGAYNRLFDSYDDENPVMAHFLQLFGDCLSANGLSTQLQQERPELVVGARFESGETSLALGEIAKRNLDNLFRPYVAKVPRLADALQELKTVLDEAFADHGDGALTSWLMRFEFSPSAESLSEDATSSRFDREYNSLVGRGMPEAKARLIAGWNARIAEIVRLKVLPGIANIYKTKMNALAKSFALDGFEQPVTLGDSLKGSVLSHVCSAIGLGGFGAIGLGVGLAVHKMTDKTIELRGNFNVNLSQFRAWAAVDAGRVHATDDRGMELVADKPAVSIHNAEARRALVESLIEQSRKSEEEFYASPVGRKVASLLGLDAGETMNNVEKAPPLTTELIRRVVAVVDMAELNRAPVSFTAMRTLFGNPAAIEDVSYEQVRTTLADAFRAELGNADVAAALGVDADDYDAFLRANYGKVLKRMSEIGAADPSYAQTGRTPTPEQAKRWLMAAVYQVAKDESQTLDVTKTLGEMLGPRVKALEASVDALRLSDRSPVVTALLLHGLAGDGEACIAFVRDQLGRYASSFRLPPDAKAKDRDAEARAALRPQVLDDERTPAQTRLEEIVERFGYGLAKLAADDELYQRFRTNPNDADFRADVAARVRQMIYRDNAQPPLDAVAETEKLLAYWEAKREVEEPAPQAPEPAEAADDAAENAGGGLFSGLFDFVFG